MKSTFRELDIRQSAVNVTVGTSQREMIHRSEENARIEIFSGWFPAISRFHDFARTCSLLRSHGADKKAKRGSVFLRVQETGKVKRGAIRQSRRRHEKDTPLIHRMHAISAAQLVRHASSMCSILFSQRSGARKLAFSSETRAQG